MNSAKTVEELLGQIKKKSGVYCKNLQLSTEDVEQIIATIRQNGKLKSLVLWNNGIGDSGAIKFAEFVETDTSLTDLGLGENNITSEGAIALAKALIKNQTLTLLALGENEIGPEGGQALGDTLKVNSTLEYLKLGGNKIGDDGLKGIASGLSGMSKSGLQFLDLDLNKVGDEGALALAKVLRPGEASVKQVCLYDNRIGPNGATALKACRKVKVGLFGNPVSKHPDPGEATIARQKLI